MHTSLRVTGVLPDRLLNQRFDVAGVEVDQPGGQPVTVVFAEGGCELAGEVVDVLASVGRGPRSGWLRAGSRWPGSRSRGRHPTPAGAAVVAGAEQPDPVQHGIEVLVAVTDEPRAMPLPAIDALAPVPGVGAQQLLQQRGAQPGHRSADRQLHCDQVGTEDPSAPTASATSRSTSAVNSAAIWSQSPLFCAPLCRPGAPWPPGSVGGPRRSPR